MISKQSLKTFKRLYKARFGEELTDKETLERATRLVGLFRAVYSPSLSDQSQKLTNENSNKKEQQISRIST